MIFHVLSVEGTAKHVYFISGWHYKILIGNNKCNAMTWSWTIQTATDWWADLAAGCEIACRSMLWIRVVAKVLLNTSHNKSGLWWCLQPAAVHHFVCHLLNQTPTIILHKQVQKHTASEKRVHAHTVNTQVNKLVCILNAGTNKHTSSDRYTYPHHEYESNKRVEIARCWCT